MPLVNDIETLKAISELLKERESEIHSWFEDFESSRFMIKDEYDWRTFGRKMRILKSRDEVIKSDRYPAATVTICETKEDPHDPRIPNKAGERRYWYLKVGERTLAQRHYARAMAVNHAKTLHERLVKALAEDEFADIAHLPNFGRF